MSRHSKGSALESLVTSAGESLPINCLSNKGDDTFINSGTVEVLVSLEVSTAIEDEKRVNAHRFYKRKLCLTYSVVVFIIVVTWLLFIVPLCVGIYATLISYGVIPETRDLSLNTTFFRTFSSSSCPYNITTAFSKFHTYIDWFNSNQSDARNSTYGTMIENAKCVASFVNNGTQCSPECLRYAPGGNAYYIAWRVFIFSGSFVTLFVSILGILTWIKIGGKLWVFPHIISFYLILSVLVQSICILSGQIVPQLFYCKHPSLIQSREDSTIMCSVQGGIYHYSLMVFIYWYLFAVLNLLYIFSRPMDGAVLFHKNRHWIHLFESLFCWGFPVLVLIGTVAILRSYRISNQPEFCHPSTIFVIITLYIPGLLFCLFNVTAIPIVISRLLKRYYKSTELIGRGTIGLDWVAQLVIFTIAFSISIWMVMLNFSVDEFEAPNYDIYLEQYSRCVTIFGTNGANCCAPVYREFYNNALGIASGFASTVWGLAGLSALANRDVRELWKKILTCNRCCHGDK